MSKPKIVTAFEESRETASPCRVLELKPYQEWLGLRALLA
jgi:hypothetical protein